MRENFVSRSEAKPQSKDPSVAEFCAILWIFSDTAEIEMPVVAGDIAIDHGVLRLREQFASLLLTPLRMTKFKSVPLRVHRDRAAAPKLPGRRTDEASVPTWVGAQERLSLRGFWRSLVSLCLCDSVVSVLSLGLWGEGLVSMTVWQCFLRSFPALATSRPLRYHYRGNPTPGPEVALHFSPDWPGPLHHVC